MSPVWVGLAEGARPMASEGGAAAPVWVGLLEGSRSLGSEAGEVSPVVVGVAEGSLPLDSEGGREEFEATVLFILANLIACCY